VARTLGSIVAETAAALSLAGCSESRRRARRLIASALDLSASELLAHPDRQIGERALRHLRWLLRRMIAGEPLSRTAGRREFWGLEFALSADALDPRPESETLVAAVLRRIRRDADMQLLDFGTGSGCLLLALLSELPAATGVAVDISAGAAATARMNAAALGLASRAHFFVGDWGKAVAGRFAVVVANPPYITRPGIAGLAPAVREYDPRLALDGGADGLEAYRAIGAELPSLLTRHGIFVTEVGIGQADMVAGMLANFGLAIECIEHDLAGIARCVVARPISATMTRRRTGKKLLECAIAASRVGPPKDPTAALEGKAEMRMVAPDRSGAGSAEAGRFPKLSKA
jgi:release factor glutamine methyltransferase